MLFFEFTAQVTVKGFLFDALRIDAAYGQGVGMNDRA
jgi:hypothetical protein